MSGLGRVLIVAGVILVIMGVVFLLAPKIPWLGRLPGDISFKRGNFSFYFPLGTCILISLPSPRARAEWASRLRP